MGVILPAEDLASDAPRSTALFAAAAASCEANLWTSVNGQSVARVFTTVEQEYQAAVSGVAIADFGALYHYSIRGREAAALISRAASAPAMWMEPGEVGAGLVLDGAGGVADLVDAACMTKELYLLASSLPMSRALQLAARGLEAGYENIGHDVAALAVIGPQAAAALEKAGYKNLPETGALSRSLRGVETAIRSISYGAAQGYELIVPQAEALVVWERLLRKGAARPIGLDTLEILRIEGGAPRPGLDFAPARAGREGRSPAALGLSHLAPMDRGWFGGRRALRECLAPTARLITLAVDADFAPAGVAVLKGGKAVGRITSSAFSPRRRSVVAFADVSSASGGKTYEIPLSPDAGKAAAARVIETAESAREAAFLAR